jgi:DNA-binding NarL/FixJ family response regulator
VTVGEGEPAASAVASRPTEDDACVGQSNGARTAVAPPTKERSAATAQAERRNSRLPPTSTQITELPPTSAQTTELPPTSAQTTELPPTSAQTTEPPSAERTVGARPVRVLLADAAPMHRSGLRLALAETGDLIVVGEAGDGAAAVDLARRLLPDVVVMDIRLPRLDGLAATRAIATAQLPVRVLILTTFDLDEHVLGAIGAGAAGFLPKDVPAGELVAAIRTVGSGGAVIAPAILARLLARLADALPDPVATAAAPGLDKLTEREREVFLHVARGHTNAEIARALTVSETTIKTHVGHLLTKLGLRDRVQAVVLAYESGLVKPGN